MAAATTWGWWRWNVELTKNIWLNLDISYNFPQQGQFSNQVDCKIDEFSAPCLHKLGISQTKLQPDHGV